MNNIEKEIEQILHEYYNDENQPTHKTTENIIKLFRKHNYVSKNEIIKQAYELYNKQNNSTDNPKLIKKWAMDLKNRLEREEEK